MSIKEERPSQRRMMMRLDRDFLDVLPAFKQGFGEGNELGLLVAGMGLGEHKDENILDIGSADGDWLGKMTSMIWHTLDRPSVRFTAIEPIEENPKLARLCNQPTVTWVPTRLEECDSLKDGSFDIITSTHCAYYYYNQPLAHEQLFRLLKPDGKLIVTLVSQHCVLNYLTEELLGLRRQFTLNAESYMAMMSKLGWFSIKRVETFRGGFNSKFYTSSDERLTALERVLARHRLREIDVSRNLDFFGTAVKKYQGWSRSNVIMFFEKARWTPTHQRQDPGLRPDVQELVRTVQSVATEVSNDFPSDRHEVFNADLDSFVREAESAYRRVEYLKKTGERLIQSAVDAHGQANRLQEAIEATLVKLIDVK